MEETHININIQTDKVTQTSHANIVKKPSTWRSKLQLSEKYAFARQNGNIVGARVKATAKVRERERERVGKREIKCKPLIKWSLKCISAHCRHAHMHTQVIYVIYERNDIIKLSLLVLLLLSLFWCRISHTHIYFKHVTCTQTRLKNRHRCDNLWLVQFTYSFFLSIFVWESFCSVNSLVCVCDLLLHEEIEHY